MLQLIEKWHWQQAHDLLSYQLERLEDGKNKHLRSLSLFSYLEHVKKNSIYSGTDYFKTYVQSELFWGMNKEFFVIKYGVPKGKLDTRTYRILSLPMRLIHYSYGVYLLRLTEGFLEETIKKNKRIKSFYGANLKLEKDKLILSPGRIWFFEQYRDFKKTLKYSLKKNTGKNKIALTLDVASFYDNINLKLMMSRLSKVLSNSTKIREKFAGSNLQEITEFYDYLMTGEGIPQSDNDLVSDFIAFLFLSLVDLSLEDLIAETLPAFEFTIVRFVDDYSIVIEFDAALEKAFVFNSVRALSERIADLFFYEWELRLNSKADIFDLEKPEDLERFMKKIKKVSNPYAFIESEDVEDGLVDSAQEILAKINELKAGYSKNIFSTVDGDFEILKKIYSPQVQNLFKRADIKADFESAFSNVDFSFVKICPREITCLMSLSPSIWENYVLFLVAMPTPSSRDANLINQALCQSEFQDNRLIQKLSEIQPFSAIKKLIQDAVIDLDSISYLNLNVRQTEILIESKYLISQVKNRSFAQKEKNLALATNHLCTEIIELYVLLTNRSRKELKEITALNILEWSTLVGCPNADKINIKNLFDRRNNNGISHSALTERPTDGFELDEYMAYLLSVEKLFHKAIAYFVRLSTAIPTVTFPNVSALRVEASPVSSPPFVSSTPEMPVPPL